MIKTYEEALDNIRVMKPAERAAFLTRLIKEKDDQLTWDEIRQLKLHIALARKQVAQHAKF